MVKILVIAAHPDDEVLGCGGAIARHTKSGDEVHIYTLAEGITSRRAKRNRETCSQSLKDLANAANKAGSILGVKSITMDNLPDNRLDSLDRLDLIKKIEKFIQNIKPNIIYTHHSGDLNIDHRRVHEAVVTACRPVPKNLVNTLLFFEVPSSTEWQIPGAFSSFVPNWFVDISNTLENKLKALQAYESEMRPWPHSRSIKAVEHLARWRGASIGVEAAEGFILGRKII
ncbi:MAG: GlcNAc-PI de-N-acetylase [Candidatus Parabeggiatoa sp. nov. 2]|nr:MAG: GlcNAc-PI de-N-acetylase [Beggiatoa sp. 4572_84]